MASLQPPPELLGALRESLLALDVMVVGGGVEVAHRRDIDLSAAGLDSRRGQLGEPGVEGAAAQGCGENQEPDGLTGPGAVHQRARAQQRPKPTSCLRR